MTEMSFSASPKVTPNEGTLKNGCLASGCGFPNAREEQCNRSDVGKSSGLKRG